MRVHGNMTSRPVTGEQSCCHGHMLSLVSVPILSSHNVNIVKNLLSSINLIANVIFLILILSPESDLKIPT